MSHVTKLSVLVGALLCATAVPALANPSGFISLGAGVTSVSPYYSDTTYDGSAVELAASGAYQFTPELGAQGDLVLKALSTDYEYATLKSNEIDGALHGFFRNDSFLAGGFVQLGKTNLDDGYVDEDWTRVYFGGEVQAYIDQLTLYGQLGWYRASWDGEGGPDFDNEGWFASIEGRFFITDDFRLDVHGGITTAEYTFGPEDSTTYNLGIGAEYKLPDSPISLFGKLDYYTQNFGGGDSEDRFRVLVGAKFTFGDDTLKARDRAGATLKPVEALPIYAPKG